MGCHQTIVINQFDYCHHPKRGVEAPQPQTGTGIEIGEQVGCERYADRVSRAWMHPSHAGHPKPHSKLQGVQRDWSLRIRPGIGENPFGFQDRYWAVLDAS